MPSSIFQWPLIIAPIAVCFPMGLSLVMFFSVPRAKRAVWWRSVKRDAKQEITGWLRFVKLRR